MSWTPNFNSRKSQQCLPYSSRHCFLFVCLIFSKFIHCVVSDLEKTHRHFILIKGHWHSIFFCKAWNFCSHHCSCVLLFRECSHQSKDLNIIFPWFSCPVLSHYLLLYYSYYYVTKKKYMHRNTPFLFSSFYSIHI